MLTDEHIALAVDDRGFIKTGSTLGPQTRRGPRWRVLERDPYLLETSLPGVFAAGDVRSDPVKRMVAAVGEGSIAVRFVSEYLGRRAELLPAAASQQLRHGNSAASGTATSPLRRV